MINDSRIAAERLLTWYDHHRRDLPWRSRPGEEADPYRVWLSEIMLQQTTVPAAAPYFRNFTERWPTVRDLASAPLDDVLVAWAGLGYYARARNLYKCAQVVAGELGGRFPDTEAGLLELPGVGAYTAAAITSIAFGRKATVVDGNVERVIARVFAVEEPLPNVKPKLKALAATLTPDARPGDYAQAMMDLGATVCTPRKPKCMLCPWAEWCAARAAGIQEELPRKAAKADKPTRRGVAYWLLNPEGAVLLRRRAEEGLLGGMTEVPSTAWTPTAPDEAAVRAQAPLEAGWRRLPGTVRHTFSHFHLELEVVAAKAGDGWRRAEGLWVPVDRLGGQALPSVMMKVVRHALAHA
ncbi:A/G-specific adenine glycosylase [Azospirillum rugosum]|uniref:Adenine DNA glycosylase n=1 Tax=Azospirillum rugosum TaxID=416170 RepID=A0ABS4SJV4_9PROT|nr:A/G-specific adenine glycosylase [Azospirillum rugosum]MBP2292504.1 A/G-specific adenine glycosylase [Azospirillum rugosum]MDQ0526472.1 A/G-specific adenine glycosylase [Azospirillum rugosum]